MIQYYIHIQIKDKAPTPIKSNNVIGIDFGRRDIAVTSNGDKWDGKQINDVRDKFSLVRASLQKKDYERHKIHSPQGKTDFETVVGQGEKIPAMVKPQHQQVYSSGRIEK